MPDEPSPFTTILLRGDIKAALLRAPTRPGVGQILGPEGKNLVIGRPANLRRWALGHLGLGKPPARGQRPPVDLSPLASALVFAEATSPFHHRLLFERVMERHVPRSKRRDLKPPFFLHLDARERFPRLALRPAVEDPATSFGPFRDRRSAERALVALHKVFPLRPCDYLFEPHPELPLGLGCLYAQVRSCSAPCLKRTSEADYRDLARQVTAVLAGDAPRPPGLEAVLPYFVARAGARGLVVASKGEVAELYPVRSGAVAEEARVRLAKEGAGSVGPLEAALAALHEAAPPATPRDDRPWVLPWILGKNRGGAYLVVGEDESEASLAARVRQVLS